MPASYILTVEDVPMGLIPSADDAAHAVDVARRLMPGLMETAQPDTVAFTPLPAVGTRVKVSTTVDRYPHFLARPGMAGEVVADYGTGDTYAVRLDDTAPGLAEWDNQLCWSEDLAHDIPAQLEPDACPPAFPSAGDIDKAADDALVDGFWPKVVERFPEVTHGDMAPGEVDPLEDAAKAVLNVWLQNNHPALTWHTLPRAAFYLADVGAETVSTGGGCEAVQIGLDDGSRILVTSDYDMAGSPGWRVGLYDPEDAAWEIDPREVPNADETGQMVAQTPDDLVALVALYKAVWDERDEAFETFPTSNRPEG